MATTSSTLAASTAADRGGDGGHSKWRAAGLVATAALGLSLLAGGILGQGRQTIQPAALPDSRVNPY